MLLSVTRHAWVGRFGRSAMEPSFSRQHATHAFPKLTDFTAGMFEHDSVVEGRRCSDALLGRASGANIFRGGVSK